MSNGGHLILALSLQKDGWQALQKDGGPQYDITYLRGRQALQKDGGRGKQVKPALDS